MSEIKTEVIKNVGKAFYAWGIILTIVSLMKETHWLVFLGICFIAVGSSIGWMEEVKK